MRSLLLLYLLLALAHRGADAATDITHGHPEAGRPKIALVLSGGGARGGAHIGVIKVLEELRIPVDMVVGTSAGAIVGAAYASGMSVAEIEHELASVNTTSLFHDIARRDLGIERKADAAGGYIGPEIGIGRNGLSLPKGALAGVALEGVLRRLTARQRSQDFGRFPTPFRAVATDVVSGEMVVLASGNLAQAVRASMAIPAVITPVEIDGRLLMDGGAARNLPVDVARAMGADIVLAVNIGSPLLKREEISSVLSMSTQVTRMLTAANVRVSLRELGPRDVLITPDLGQVGTASFDMLLQAQNDGERAAHAASERLAPYALSAADYAARAAARPAAAEEPFLLREMRIVGAQRVPEAFIRATMDTRVGQVFNTAGAERDMRRLFGRGDFEHVSYALDRLPGGGHAMTTTVNEKSWGPQYLRLGVGVSTDFQGDSFFTLRAGHRWTWLNRLGAEWRNDIEIGHSDRLGTEWLQPLTPAGRLFASATVAAERTPLDVYKDGERLVRFRRQSLGAGVDLGLPLGQWGEARAGFARTHLKTLNDTSLVPVSLLFQPTRTAGLQLRLRADTLDNAVFPRSGVQADLRIYAARTALGADAHYTKLSFNGRGALAQGPHSLQAELDVQDRLGANALPDTELVPFGGFLRLSGYRTGELLGSSLHFGKLVYHYRISSPGLLDGAYIGVSAESGRMRNTIAAVDGEQVVHANALYVAVDTLLGPMYLGVGRTTRNNKAVYFMLGKP